MTDCLVTVPAASVVAFRRSCEERRVLHTKISDGVTVLLYRIKGDTTTVRRLAQLYGGK